MTTHCKKCQGFGYTLLCDNSSCDRPKKECPDCNGTGHVEDTSKDERIKELEEQLNEWTHAMAYFTKEDIPTPDGVTEFIEKELIKDKPNSSDKRIKELADIKDAYKCTIIPFLKQRIEELEEKLKGRHE